MMEKDQTKKQEDKLPYPSSPVPKDEQFGTFRVNNEAPHAVGSFYDDNGAGAINVHLNNMPPMLPASPSVNMLGMSHSHTQGIPKVDFSKFNSSRTPWINRDSLLSHASNFLPARASVNEFGQYPIIEDLPLTSNLENSFNHVHHLEKPTGTMSIGPTDKFAGDIQMDSEGKEAIGSEIHGSQLVGNFKRKGLRTAVLCPPPRVGAAHSKHLEKLDGSYLNLGVGGSLEARSESHFSSGDNPRIYMGTVLPEENSSRGQIGQRSYLNSGFNRTAGFSSLPNNADGSSRFPNNAGVYPSLEQNEISCVADNPGAFPIPLQNMDGWALSSNDFGMPYGEGTRFGWNPSLTSHMLPTDVQYQYPMPSTYARFAVADHTENFGDPPAAALTPHSGVGRDVRSTVTGLPSSSLVMRSDSQLASGPPQNCNLDTFHNLSSEPPMVSPSVAVMGSNKKRLRSGNVGQPQALGLLQPAQKFLRVANTSGQAIPINNDNRADFESKDLVRPLLQTSRIATPEVQHRLIGFPKPSCDLSTPDAVKTVPLSPLAHTGPYPGLVAHHARFASMPCPNQSPDMKWPGISSLVQHKGINFPKPFSHPTTPDAVKTVPLPSPVVYSGPSPAFVAHRSPHASMPAPTQSPHITRQDISPQVQQRISFSKPSSYSSTPDVVKTVTLPSTSIHTGVTGPSPTFVAQHAPHASIQGPTQSPHMNWQQISSQAQQRMISLSKPSSHQYTPDAVKTVPLPSPLAETGHSPAMIDRPAPHTFMPSPPQIPHIKRQRGLSKTTPPPSGKNCPLCKRDLSYTPEGPVFQPINPPKVACLPCSHMFHDHCLKLIIPADMEKDPPCIPCAMGES